MKRLRSILSGAILAAANPAAGQAPVLQLDLAIGCESCGGATQFSRIQALAVSSKGEIVVVDRDAPLVRRFDADGKPVWSGGTRGGGPGEYQLVFHAAFLPNGGLAFVDMTARRITALGADHRVASTTQMPLFATTAGSDHNGSIVIAAEGPRGSLDFARWRAGTVTPMQRPISTPAGAMTARSSSVAISPGGVLAAFVDNHEYTIVRFDSAGTRLPDLTRTVARVRRTNEEEAELRANAARGAAMVAAEARSRGGSARGAVPVLSEAERTLKPHAKIDGMQYDASGRLWIQTMRGDGSTTVFDLFSASGTFAGSITVPRNVQLFAVGGTYLVTAGENDDGIPQVIRWRLR